MEKKVLVHSYPDEQQINEIDNVPKKLLDFKPDKNYHYYHVIAMGAGEYYGSNSNGDYFPEVELIGFCENDKCFGFITFVTHGKVFVEHDSSDPSKAIGKIVKTFYNHDMHRVELIIAIDKNKGKKFIDKFDDGERLYVSMGCRVKYDKCSICDNVAFKSRSEYCVHGKTQLNKILPDGRKVYRINYAPVFYDISIVKNPADKTAFFLSKVASEKNVEFNPEIVIKHAYMLDVPSKYVDLNLIKNLIPQVGIPTNVSDYELVENLKKSVKEKDLLQINYILALMHNKLLGVK